MKMNAKKRQDERDDMVKILLIFFGIYAVATASYLVYHLYLR